MAVFSGLTVVSLLLPGLGFSESVEAVKTVGSFAFRNVVNGSLAYRLGDVGIPLSAMVAVFATGAAVTVFFISRQARQAPSLQIPVLTIAVALALLVSPLSWAHYGLMLYPPLFALVTQGEDRFGKVAAITVIALLSIWGLGGWIDTLTWIIAVIIGFAAYLKGRTADRPDEPNHMYIGSGSEVRGSRTQSV